jgi:hypothetical protein
VDLTFQRLRRGDTLVLCSDGLSGQVTRDDIARIASEEKDLVQACRRLIDLANDAGGPDNITVIIARFEGAGLSDAEVDGDEVAHRPFPMSDGMATPAQPLDMSQAPTQRLRRSVSVSTPQAALNALASSGAAAPAAPEGASAPAVPTAAAESAAMGTARDSDESDVPTLESIDLSKIPVRPARRSRGMAIAMVLLALMIGFGAWYAVRTFNKVQPEPTPTTPTP